MAEATYISATSFAVNGDETAKAVAGRAVRATCSGSYVYGRIESSSYASPITTVVLDSNSQALNIGLTAVDLGEQSEGTSGTVPEHSHTNIYNGGLITLSGSVNHNATGGLQGGTTDEYYHLTAAEYTELQAGYVSDSEITTISGDIVAQIPSLTGYATESYVDNHNWLEADITDLDKYTQAEVNALIAAASGTTDHSLLTNLDYASAGHTGFQPAGDYITSVEMTTISGDIIAQIPSLAGYATESYVTTVSGDIVAQIPSLAGYATESYVDTASGTLQSQITTNANDIASNAASIAVVSGTADTNTTNIGYNTASIAVISGTADQNTADIAVVSGSLDSHTGDTSIHFTVASLDSVYATDAELATVSGILHDQIVASAANASTIYYLHDQASDVGGYELLDSVPSDGAEDYDELIIGSGDGETLFEAYATASGSPNTDTIIGGTWIWRLFASVDSVAFPSYIRAKWYRREQSGTEHYLFTQEQELTSTDITAYTVQTTVSGIDTNVTDRLVVKMYAQTDSVIDRTIRYYYQGQNNATRWNTPVYTSLISYHNDLLGLQGGQADQYYHLTAAEYTDYISGTEVAALITTASGDIVSQIPSLAGYATEAYVTTVSGDIVAQIPLTFLNLTDTPATYSGGAFLQSTTSGLVWNANLASDKIIEGNTYVECKDTGTGSIVQYVDGVLYSEFSSLLSYRLYKNLRIQNLAANNRIGLGDDGGNYDAAIAFIGNYSASAADYWTITYRQSVDDGLNISNRTDDVLLLQQGGDAFFWGSVAVGGISNYINEFSTDGTMSGNSDSAVPTEQAIVEYVDTVSGSLVSYANGLYNTLDSKIDTTSGTLQYAIDHVVATVSGSDHSTLGNLDYASSGHTGFASSTDLATVSGLVDTNTTNIGYNTASIALISGTVDTNAANITATSGTLQSQIDSLDNTYMTDAEFTTASGDIVSQIAPAVTYENLNANGDVGTGATQVSQGNHTHAQLHDREHSMTGTSDHTANNWKLFYSDGSGDIQEIAIGSEGHVLKSNGPAIAPQFSTASGIGISNLVEDTSPELGGDLDMNDNYIIYTASPTSDDAGSGVAAYMTVDENTFGVACALHMDTDGHWIMCDADSSSLMPCGALALETGTGTKKVLMHGFMRNDGWNWSPGAIIYVDNATSGGLTTTKPSGSGDQVQVVGIATHADRIFFNPSYVIATVA